MEITEADLPLAYAEFRLQSQNGKDAVIIKAHTYTDLARIIGYLPSGLKFLVYMYCNGIRVGSGVYRKENSRVRLLRESGACKNLFEGVIPAAPVCEEPLLPA